MEHALSSLCAKLRVRRETNRKYVSLYPEKTHLIEFEQPCATNRARCGRGKPETFTLLGSVLICEAPRRRLEEDAAGPRRLIGEGMNGGAASRSR
jgi:hypothetical protein